LGNGSTLQPVACHFEGGSNGFWRCTSSTFSGHGLNLSGSTAFTLDCTFAAGAFNPGCDPHPFYVGLPVHISEGGSHHLQSGTPCALTASAFVERSGTLMVNTSGEPGSALLIGFSLGAQLLHVPQALGSLLLADPLDVSLQGVLPASGTETWQLPIGPLAPGVESMALHAQSGLILPSGAFQLCSGTTITVLASRL